MKASAGTKFMWTVLFVVVVPLIIYALYSGLTIGRIALPGGFEIEFRDVREALAAEDELKTLDGDELAARQADMERKLREMEAQLMERDETEAPRSRVQNISGAWQSPVGLSYQIEQQGRDVTIQEITPYYGITAIGEGEIRDGVLRISYRTALNTTGEAHLQLSDNGKRLTGTFTDSYSGLQTQARLQRIGNSMP